MYKMKNSQFVIILNFFKNQLTINWIDWIGTDKSIICLNIFSLLILLHMFSWSQHTHTLRLCDRCVKNETFPSLTHRIIKLFYSKTTHRIHSKQTHEIYYKNQ